MPVCRVTRPGSQSGAKAKASILFGFVAIALIVSACCPAPTAAGTETAFAATIESVGTSDVTANLGNGSRVNLELPPGASAPAAGSKVWVEGSGTGNSVLVRSFTVIERVAADAGPD